MKKTYKVRLEWRTVIHDTVEAESEEEAIKDVEGWYSSNDIGLHAEGYSADAEEKMNCSVN